jgi:SAM-dependent methyltransferase
MGDKNPTEDLIGYNRQAWNQQVRNGSQWTQPVSPEVIAAARNGDWSIILTPVRKVPGSWFPDIADGNCRVLCLAGSGGQQAPVLAAAGASVTVLDLSPDQLAQDRLVAQREGLEIELIEGDMRELGCFVDNQFDLVVHPCSNGFVPNVNPVWKEAARVLKPGGELLSGFTKPVFHLFDDDEMEKGNMKVVHSIPYSDLNSISDQRRQKFIDAGEPMLFGHALSDLIGGQIAAGFSITGYYEDVSPDYAICEHVACFAATKATLRCSVVSTE